MTVIGKVLEKLLQQGMELLIAFMESSVACGEATLAVRTGNLVYYKMVNKYYKQEKNCRRE